MLFFGLRVVFMKIIKIFLVFERVFHHLNKLLFIPLWLLCTVISVIIAELIVSGTEIVLKGEITHDYLLTGLITDLLTACPIIGFLIYLLRKQEDIVNALIQSEQEFCALFNSSRDAILIMSPERLVIKANPSAAMMFGCGDAQELIGLSPIGRVENRR
jgi:PAS domain-containing protein